MNICCKLGLHSWKPHYVYRREVRTKEMGMFWYGFFPEFYFFPIPPTNFWPLGQKCRRCGVRK